MTATLAADRDHAAVDAAAELGRSLCRTCGEPYGDHALAPADCGAAVTMRYRDAAGYRVILARPSDRGRYIVALTGPGRSRWQRALAFADFAPAARAFLREIAWAALGYPVPSWPDEEAAP